MLRRGLTLKDATQTWVSEFNAFPETMISKLMELEPDSWREITKPSIDDRVYLFDRSVVDENGDEYYGTEVNGEIIDKTDDGKYIVELDDDSRVIVDEDDIEIERDEYLPMWGTLWQFGDRIDDWWLEEKGGLQIMSDCGFRVYESDEYGYFFGIDGCGYSFFTEHWIPLYKARGLQWHDTEAEGK